MRYISSIALILFGATLIFAVLAQTEGDLASDDWFLPPPSEVTHPLGPFAAWLSMRLYSSLGYASTIVGALATLWGISRLFRWKAKLPAIITFYAFGWLLALSLPAALITGDAVTPLLGNFGHFLADTLSPLGFAKFLLAFLVFGAWFFAASGIGFEKPFGVLRSAFDTAISAPSKYRDLKNERDRSQRTQMLEENKKRASEVKQKPSVLDSRRKTNADLPEDFFSPRAREIAETYTREIGATTPQASDNNHDFVDLDGMELEKRTPHGFLDIAGAAISSPWSAGDTKEIVSLDDIETQPATRKKQTPKTKSPDSDEIVIVATPQKTFENNKHASTKTNTTAQSSQFSMPQKTDDLASDDLDDTTPLAANVDDYFHMTRKAPPKKLDDTHAEVEANNTPIIDLNTKHDFTPAQSTPIEQKPALDENMPHSTREFKQDKTIFEDPPPWLAVEIGEIHRHAEKLAQEDNFVPGIEIKDVPPTPLRKEAVLPKEVLPETPKPQEQNFVQNPTRNTIAENVSKPHDEPAEIITQSSEQGIQIDPTESDEVSEAPVIIPPVSRERNSTTDDNALYLRETHYKEPPISILRAAPEKTTSFSEAQLAHMAQMVYDALTTYNVTGKVTAITPGPVITRFEFQPDPGIKISRIANLADDLALSMKARDVRIVAPLPGKGTVGIEIPNDEVCIVYLRSIFESGAFASTKAELPLALGKGVAGEPVVADLAKMPHLLIAGATGAGKSVCINTIITSLMYKKKPWELRLLLIDPKRIELSIYEGCPFLVTPVIVENKEAAAALNWALAEMNSRYIKLADAKVRKLADYNDKMEHENRRDEKIPFIVIVIDELADLMMTVAKEIEEPIARLAQMARAVGIHLIVATQRPSVDVVTGIIKANFPSRIAFKVRSKIDSRTILDLGGAERLLGNGDMLYLPSGFADAVRIHGAYISTEETEALVKYLQQFANPQLTELSFTEEENAKTAAGGERDELFWEAAKVLVMSQKGSASHLQRKLRVGYTRAASILDQLELYGIVGPFEGSKARQVVIQSLDELDRLREEFS